MVPLQSLGGGLATLGRVAFPAGKRRLMKWRARMDPRKFDELVQKLSKTVSRRSMVGGTVGASVLTAVGLGSGDAGDDALAKGNGGNGKHKAQGQGGGHHKSDGAKGQGGG